MTDWLVALFSGAVGAVLATALTTMLSWRATWVSYTEAATQRALDLDRLFINHPKLRSYFYGGNTLPSEDDDPLIFAAMEFIADNLEGIWDHEDVYGDSDWDSWLSYINTMQKKCPALKDFVARNEYEWYPSLKSLESLDPSKPRPRVPRLRRLWRDARGKE